MGKSIEELILSELMAIRKLLEWQKTDTLWWRQNAESEIERCKAEALAMNEGLLEKAKANALDVQRQSYREHEMRSHGLPPTRKEENVAN